MAILIMSATLAYSATEVILMGKKPHKLYVKIYLKNGNIVVKKRYNSVRYRNKWSWQVPLVGAERESTKVCLYDAVYKKGDLCFFGTTPEAIVFE